MMYRFNVDKKWTVEQLREQIANLLDEIRKCQKTIAETDPLDRYTVEDTAQTIEYHYKGIDSCKERIGELQHKTVKLYELKQGDKFKYKVKYSDGEIHLYDCILLSKETIAFGNWNNEDYMKVCDKGRENHPYYISKYSEVVIEK